jgi:hypothetical protein
MVEVLPKGGGVISTSEQISPLKDLQIHAQISNSGYSGDVGDIFRMMIICHARKALISAIFARFIPRQAYDCPEGLEPSKSQVDHLLACLG